MFARTNAFACLSLFLFPVGICIVIGLIVRIVLWICAAFVYLLAELRVVKASGEFSQTLAGSEKSRRLGREAARRFADPFPEYIKRRANFPSFGLTHSLAHTHSLSLAETRDRNEAVWLAV